MPEPVASRRDVLRLAMGLAVFAAAPRCFAGAAPGGADAPRVPAGTRIDVRTHGARGDAVADDTPAFQRAIDALPDEGGTIVVPSGAWRIDAARGVRLRNAMRLEMASDARLIAIPNAAPRSNVLLARGVDDIEIAGGRIVGERGAHLGTQGEWGHGLAIRGCRRVRVRSLHAANCWGDGISIGANKIDDHQLVPSQDIVLQGVRCEGNRRQGLTIGRARRVRVLDSAFLGTGGTAPGYGIDIEPDPGDVAQDILIRRCLLQGNRGGGIQLFDRVSGVSILDCRIVGNGGVGILVANAADCEFAGNRLDGNGLRGIRLRGKARDIRIHGNAFNGNGPRSHGKARWKELDIAADAQRIHVAEDNRFD